MKHTIRYGNFEGFVLHLQSAQRQQRWSGGSRVYWQVLKGNQKIDQGMAENEQMALLYAQEAVKRHQQRTVQQQPTPSEKPAWTLQELLQEAGFPGEDSAAD
ncbi:hypothetical protein [Deinococcus roseus]|uniref:Uncharacterized protein n=1 Tax=Deinococcus roseus TaxID=392414 RepID=A0ABQ2CZX2_9DEIO|nr:hypothetical protein [Deinococcus roseus]GGJ35801.1 hypothetical protein GCM10008938_22430 [Deinococcus roseus]